MSGDSKAAIEVGKAGWTLPIPIVKDGAEWRFDVAAGLKEMVLRRIGHDEASVVQTLLAIVDAQSDYAALDPMKTGAPAYARRLLSSPGKKDGLYWETKPGEPQSPLGPAVAKAQADGQSPDGHYGYYFRLLYAQGPAAPGGARDYVVNGRMIGGFGVDRLAGALRRDRRDDLHRQPGRRRLSAGPRAADGAEGGRDGDVQSRTRAGRRRTRRLREGGDERERT